jgi:hypothetical protein
MFEGWVCGSGARMITTPAGERGIRESGLDLLVVDPAVARLHDRDWKGGASPRGCP